MRLLIDSSVLLWWLEGTPRLTAAATQVMSDGSNELIMSAASLWELSIKQSIGKLRIAVDLRDHALQQGFTELAVSGIHGVAVRELPFHHKNPFDRMLVAQAQIEGLTLLTADRTLSSYDVPVMLATA